ncbi:MAG: hypothetical protein U0L76_02080 [Ruminococcus sp.]|nr:hypothetical protein [Ruminococcus sp.]
MKNKKVLYSLIIIIVFIICIVLSSVVSYNLGYNKALVTDKTQNTDATVPTTEPIEGFSIETPYCELYYPKKWENSVEIKKNSEEPYTVEFYATINDKSDLHLFDFIFNSADGVLIGELTTDDGNSIKVSVESYELNTDKLSDDEISTFYLMQEDINYTLQKLISEDNFTESN